MQTVRVQRISRETQELEGTEVQIGKLSIRGCNEEKRCATFINGKRQRRQAIGQEGIGRHLGPGWEQRVTMFLLGCLKEPSPCPW